MFSSPCQGFLRTFPNFCKFAQIAAGFFMVFFMLSCRDSGIIGLLCRKNRGLFIAMQIIFQYTSHQRIWHCCIRTLCFLYGLIVFWGLHDEKIDHAADCGTVQCSHDIRCCYRTRSDAKVFHSLCGGCRNRYRIGRLAGIGILPMAACQWRTELSCICESIRRLLSAD